MILCPYFHQESLECGFSWGTETECLRSRLKDNLNRKGLMKTGIKRKKINILMILKLKVFLIT